jgi:hypothetical protein
MLRKHIMTVLVVGLVLAAARVRAADESSEPLLPPAAAVPAHSKLSPELQALQNKVRRALQIYSGPRLNSRDHNAWEMMHAIIGYGVRSQIHRDGPHGPAASTIGWLCYNFPCKGERMLTVEQGRVDVRRGVGVQGHPGQFLAILAQSRVQTSYPIMCNGKRFTVADLIESEKRGCKTGMELTFKLISMSHYLDSDETWKNEAGEEWSISRLIHEEIKAPINGAACGGTHRLMGLSYAARKRAQQGQPIDGEFRRAKNYTDEFHRYTLSLQNGDGSFSTEWFKEAGARADVNRRLQTSGHILEWLAFSLPEEELTEPRMVKAVNYLAGILVASPQREWEIGPLGHAMHSLVIYDERVFRARELPEQMPLASKEPARRSMDDDDSDDETPHQSSRRRDVASAHTADTEPAKSLTIHDDKPAADNPDAEQPSPESVAADKSSPAMLPTDKSATEDASEGQPAADKPAMGKPVASAPAAVPDDDATATSQPQPLAMPEAVSAPRELAGDTASPPTKPLSEKPLGPAAYPVTESVPAELKPAPLSPTGEDARPADPMPPSSAQAPAETASVATSSTTKRSPALPRHIPAWRR